MKRTLAIIALLICVAAGWDKAHQPDIEPGEYRHVEAVRVEFHRNRPGTLFFNDFGNFYVLIMPTNSIRCIDVEFSDQH